MQMLYLVLCIAGTLVPLATFVPWLHAHGLNVPLLVQQAMTTPVASFAWSDVVVSACALVVFVLIESRRLGMRRGWIALLGLVVGVSLALPLFLLLRQRHLVTVAGQTRTGINNS